MKRDPRPVAVYLTVQGNAEELIALFYNERSGFSAFELARRYARSRVPHGWSPTEVGWRFRFERVQPQEAKV